MRIVFGALIFASASFTVGGGGEKEMLRGERGGYMGSTHEQASPIKVVSSEKLRGLKTYSWSTHLVEEITNPFSDHKNDHDGNTKTYVSSCLH